MPTNHPTAPVRRALTPTELDRVTAAVAAATGTADLADRVLRAVYDTLLADHGRSLDTLAPAQRLATTDYAIPTAQWQAIVGAVTNRAQQWGTAATIALDLINLMPSSYDDPTVPTPDFPTIDHRPRVHDLHITREATDVITACEQHVHRLGAYYGPTSPQHLTALTSWHHQLARLFGMSLGADTHISRDGDLSLFVSTAGGIVYAVIFHGAHRRCTVAGCPATIGDDGTATPSDRDGAAGHDHLPSYPLDAPRPGQWTFHS